MKKENIELNKYRLRQGPYQTTDEDGLMGMFVVPGKGIDLRIMSSGSFSELGWEHVSVSTSRRCPNWEEMCKTKALFWDEDETVIQYHPRKDEYRNLHPYCLHLWKKAGVEWELPPGVAV